MQEIKNKITDGSLILFVGAGVSASVGAPTFPQLISRIGIDMGYDPQVFMSYGTYYSLAQYFINVNGGIDKLKVEMEREWRALFDKVDASSLYETIVKLKVSTIYTTNYDNFLERAHEARGVKVSKIVNLCDMQKNNMNDRKIIKYHGDFSDSATIVLSESSYFDRMDWESPLDIRLHNDLLSNSVLFIGYSIGDMNMRYLLYKISKMRSRATGISQKSYVYYNAPNPIQQSVLGKWGVEVIHGEEINPTKSLQSFLGSLV